MLLRIRSTCRIRLLLRLRVARRAAMCRTVACWYSRSDAPDGDARLQALSNIGERYRSPTQTRPSQLVEYDRRPAPPLPDDFPYRRCRWSRGVFLRSSKDPLRDRASCFTRRLALARSKP